MHGAHGPPTHVIIDLTELREIDRITKISEQELEQIANTMPRRDAFLRTFSRLEDVLDPNFWDSGGSSQGEERERKRAKFLADLACSRDSAPHVARRLISNWYQLSSLYPWVQLFADRLRSDATTCPGVKGLTDEDWKNLDDLVTLARSQAPDQKAK